MYHELGGAMHGSPSYIMFCSELFKVYQDVGNKVYDARLLLVDFSKAFDHTYLKTVLNKLNMNDVLPMIIR